MSLETQIGVGSAESNINIYFMVTFAGENVIGPGNVVCKVVFHAIFVVLWTSPGVCEGTLCCCVDIGFQIT